MSSTYLTADSWIAWSCSNVAADALAQFSRSIIMLAMTGLLVGIRMIISICIPSTLNKSLWRQGRHPPRVKHAVLQSASGIHLGARYKKTCDYKAQKNVSVYLHGLSAAPFTVKAGDAVARACFDSCTPGALGRHKPHNALLSVTQLLPWPLIYDQRNEGFLMARVS